MSAPSTPRGSFPVSRQLELILDSATPSEATPSKPLLNKPYEALTAPELQSLSYPIILFSPKEKRGWLLPRLSVMELMALLNVDRYGFSERLPSQNLDLQKIRENLLESIQEYSLKNILSGGNEQDSLEKPFLLRELLISMWKNLDLAGDCARYQQRFSLNQNFQDTIYGLELRNLALKDNEYYIKKCHLKGPKTSWAPLL